MPRDRLKALSGLSGSRLAALPAASAILEAMVEVFEPPRVIVSAFGLREGLLYSELEPSRRAEDPLLAAALEIGERLGRFSDHGAVLDQWIAPLFGDDPPDARRLRLAACLLGDIAWNAHPDYRAERAVDLATHGNWVGIDARGRAILGRTLCAAFGGELNSAGLKSLLSPAQDRRAGQWGRAIRLAQRLSAGTEQVLRHTALLLDNGTIVLSVANRHRALYAEAVEAETARGQSAFVALDPGDDDVARGGFAVTLPLGGEAVAGQKRVLLVRALRGAAASWLWFYITIASK